jgi:hypothetical protein
VHELSEWVDMAEGFAGKLQEFDLICFYCAKPFEGNVVNSLCELNTPDEEEGHLIHMENSMKDLNGCRHKDGVSSNVGAGLDHHNTKSLDKPIKGFTISSPPDFFMNNSR